MFKVQETGLVSAYYADDNVRHFVGELDGLAFLPLCDIPAGMTYLKNNVPNVSGLRDLLEYFDTTYVSGSFRSARTSVSRRQVVRFRRSPPLFPPALWNVPTATLTQQERTNNVCEGWNNAFSNLEGHNHPSVWILLEALQQDQALAPTDLALEARGQPSSKRIKRATEQQQSRLYNLCCDRCDNIKTIEQTLQD